MIPNYLSMVWAANAPALINHLWQSTLFVVVAGLLTLVLRKNQARSRYWLWMAASVKFLIPFSLLVGIGSHWAAPGRVSETRADLYFAMDQFSQPFAPTTASVAAPRISASHLHWHAWLPGVLLAAWFCGFTMVLMIWLLRWKRISQSVRDATLMCWGRELAALRRMERAGGMRTPIRALMSLDSAEPGVFGVIRPVLLWPAGISGHLEEAHLETIFAHELQHIRRRDNLTAAIHMLVEALFWFHPPVWWLGTRLVEERERACDEEVLQLCKRPEVYAESILKVCELCLESPLACVAGVTGSDLKKRIVRIMTERRGMRLSLARKMLVSAAAVVVLAGPLGFGLLHAMQANAPLLHATTNPPLSFEVATIKPNKDENSVPNMLSSSSLFQGTRLSLKDLIKFAYQVKSSDQIVGGASWMSSECFDIQARYSKSETEAITELPFPRNMEEAQLVVQSLLADRFQLKVSFKTEELPVYALVVAKGGPKVKQVELSPFPPPGTAPPPGAHFPYIDRTGPNQMTASAIPMSLMAAWLSQFDELGNRIVVDETGLKGNYDWVLNGISMAPSADSSVTSIFTALQEQLGLKLVSQKAPVEVLVVDHAERPSEN